MDGADQGVEGALDLRPEGLRLVIVAVDQPLRLAREVRPAAQPLREVAVRLPAVAHQPAGEARQNAIKHLAPAKRRWMSVCCVARTWVRPKPCVPGCLAALRLGVGFLVPGESRSDASAAVVAGESSGERVASASPGAPASSSGVVASASASSVSSSSCADARSQGARLLGGENCCSDSAATVRALPSGRPTAAATDHAAEPRPVPEQRLHQAG